MPQLVKKNPIAELSADEILRDYKAGYFTASEKNKLLRMKAEDNLTNIVNDQGYLKAILTQTVKTVQENWDTLKEIAAVPEKDIGAINDAKNATRAAWASIQIVAAPFTAFGEVSGNVAEQMALSAGASPGLAKTIGIAVDVGTGFIPVGGVTRQFAKGVKRAADTKKAAGAAKTAATAAKEVAEEAALKNADKLIDDAVKQGLKLDGVVEPKMIEAGTELATKRPDFVGPRSPKIEFDRALQGYKREMAQVTERKAHEVTLAEARKLGLTVDDLKELPLFSKLNEAEMAAYLKALDEPVNELLEMSKGVLNGTVEGTVLGKAFQNFFEYAPKFRSSEVTAGRTVEILKETPPMKPLTDLMNWWDAEAMAKMEPQAMWATLAEDLLEMADKRGMMKNLQVQGADHIAAQGYEKWWPIAREVYTNLLLSRPVTLARAFIGNTMSAANSIVEREAAGWLSISEKGVTRGEGVHQAMGMLGGLGDGLRAYGKAFVQSADDVTRLDFPLHRVTGPAGRIINLPGDNMRGMDNFFKTITKRGDIEALARQKAYHLGYTGDTFASYVARRKIMPTRDMIEHADDLANYNTFMNELGGWGKWMQKLQTGPLALWFPFMKTPINLAKYSIARTPGINLLSRSLYRDIAEGGVRADMAVARLTLSNLTGMFVFGMAQAGMITGGGPADPSVRRSWMAARKPYSIMGSDGWYPYPNLDPATTPIALMADFAEIYNQLDEPTAAQLAMGIGLAFTRDVVDKTWWQTFGDAVDIITAARGGDEWGTPTLKTAVSPLIAVTTGGPIGGALETTGIPFGLVEPDPIRREARGLVDFWRERTPGYSKTLPAKPDGYGDPILPPQSLGSPWTGMVQPFTFAEFESDRVKKEGERLQVKLPPFRHTIGGGKTESDFDVTEALPGEQVAVELTNEQFDRRVQLFRETLRSPTMGIEAGLLDNPDYQRAPWAAQRELFHRYIRGAHKTANNMLLAEDKGLVENIARARGGKYLPMAFPEDRAQVEAQFESQLRQSLDQMQPLTPQESDNLLRWGDIREPVEAAQ